MKNIHVLPTDKPSRLWINNLLQGKLELSKEALSYNTAQNIYITNDEEIKEGDWYINTFVSEREQKPQTHREKRHIINHQKDYRFKYCKKIILTTDQDLTKGGVQEIDYDFLEWFVKNPSCERVEIEINSYMDKNISDSITFTDYKIIIPKEEHKPFKDMLPLTEVDWERFKKNPIPSKKEEPKNICIQTGLPCGMQCLSEEACNSIRLKQETLEEVSEMHFEWTKDDETLTCKDHFISGAKWQQEQILDFLYSEITERRDYSASKMCEKVIEFIEQFKNK